MLSRTMGDSQPQAFSRRKYSLNDTSVTHKSFFSLPLTDNPQPYENMESTQALKNRMLMHKQLKTLTCNA